MVEPPSPETLSPLSLMENIKEFTASPEDEGLRLDVYLASKFPDYTRSGIKNLIEDSRVTLNGKIAKAGQKIKNNDIVAVKLPERKGIGVKPENIPLDILYEDGDVIVVNKPYGMPAHPGAGRDTGTLVNALVHYTDRLSSTGGPQRPGIVHRLDKDTTGVMIVARNEKSHTDLARQFKEHSTKRKYLALVWGVIENDEGVIDFALGRDLKHRKKISVRTKKSRHAITNFKVVKRYRQMSLVELMPKTGRTHQIRVHLAAINHPVVGDPVYGKKKIPSELPKEVGDPLKKIKRQLLHAEMLGFTHPSIGEYMEFTAPPPPDMAEIIKVLEKK